MKAETRRVFRLFFVWQDEAEERWLEQQAREGWRLVSPGFVYRFERAEPGEVRYRLDYRSRMPGGSKEYLDLFRDGGWEHVGRFGGWQYFRATSADAPEVFDTDSKAQKYRHLLVLLMGVLVVNGAMLASRSSVSDGVRGVQAAVVALLSYGMLRIVIRLLQLKSQGE